MSDVCLHSFYETSNGRTVDWSDQVIGSPGGVNDYDDALKFTSQLTDFKGVFGKVFSGAENCADLNHRCNNVSIYADQWIANGGKYPFTVKGGCRGIRISGQLVGHGTECDVDAGNHSDQSKEWVRDWSLNIKSVDKKPVLVRCLRAEAPRLEPDSGPYRFAFPSPYAWYHKLVVGFLGLIRVI